MRNRIPKKARLLAKILALVLVCFSSLSTPGGISMRAAFASLMSSPPPAPVARVAFTGNNTVDRDDDNDGIADKDDRDDDNDGISDPYDEENCNDDDDDGVDDGSDSDDDNDGVADGSDNDDDNDGQTGDNDNDDCGSDG